MASNASQDAAFVGSQELEHELFMQEQELLRQEQELVRNSRLPSFVTATLQASHLPRRDQLRGRAAKSGGAGRVRISSSASVPNLTASKDQLETFARAVLENLEQVDGTVSEQHGAVPAHQQRSHLSLTSAASLMPRRPQKTMGSSMSSTSLTASSVGLGGKASNANLNSFSNLSFGSVSSISIAGSTGSSVSRKSQPGGELAASPVGRPRRGMRSSDAKLDERIERIDSYSGLHEPPQRFKTMFDTPKYAIAAEIDAEQRRRKHAAARAEAEALESRRRERALRKSDRALMISVADAAAAPSSAAAAAAATPANPASSAVKVIGPYKVRTWELNPPPPPAARQRPITGLDQLHAATGIGAALATSPRHLLEHAQARRPRTGGGFLQSKRDVSTAGKEPLFSSASAADGEFIHPLERSVSAPFSAHTARAHSPMPRSPPRTSGARSYPPGLHSSRTEMSPPMADLAAYMPNASSEHSLWPGANATNGSCALAQRPSMSLVGVAASGVPAASHIAAAAPVSTPASVYSPFVQCAASNDAAHIDVPAPIISTGSGGVSAEIYRMGHDDYRPSSSKTQGSGVPGSRDGSREGGTQEFLVSAVERVQGRGVMPMRISRRWAHTAPSQGLTRRRGVPPKTHAPNGFSPYLTERAADAMVGEPRFNIAPTAQAGTEAEPAPPNSPRDGERRQALLADLAP